MPDKTNKAVCDDDHGVQQSPTDQPSEAAGASPAPREINGPKGPEPTRFGDWEQKGRCSDF